MRVHCLIQHVLHATGGWVGLYFHVVIIVIETASKPRVAEGWWDYNKTPFEYSLRYGPPWRLWSTMAFFFGISSRSRYCPCLSCSGGGGDWRCCGRYGVRRVGRQPVRGLGKLCVRARCCFRPSTCSRAWETECSGALLIGARSDRRNRYCPCLSCSGGDGGFPEEVGLSGLLRTGRCSHPDSK